MGFPMGFLTCDLHLDVSHRTEWTLPITATHLHHGSSMETVGTNKLVHLEQGEPPCHCEGEERVSVSATMLTVGFLDIGN